MDDGSRQPGWHIVFFVIGSLSLLVLVMILIVKTEIDTNNKISHNLQVQINKSTDLCERNKFAVKVLCYNSPHTVIVEGIKTKERFSIHCSQELLVPGDIWAITVNNVGSFNFVKRINYDPEAN